MKRNIVLVLVSMLLCLSVLWGISCQAPAAAPAPTAAPKPTTSPAAPAKPQVIKWVAQTLSPYTSMDMKLFGVDWVAWVKDITGGRLIIEMNPPGTFAKAGDIVPTLGKGVFDLAIDWAGQYPKTIPESNVEIGLPFAWRNYAEVWDAYYNRGLFDLVREVYAERNVFVLSVRAGGGGYHIGTKFPFNSLDDLKGKKIRAEGSYANYVEALGAKGTLIPTADLYMSLQTGVIDGYIVAASALQSYKLAELTKSYVISPEIALVAGGAPFINMNSWKALPDDLKHILEANTKHFYSSGNVGRVLDSAQTVSWAAKTHGVKFVALSPADEAKALAAAMTIWDDVAKMSPRTAKMVDIVKKQVKDYGRL